VKRLCKELFEQGMICLKQVVWFAVHKALCAWNVCNVLHLLQEDYSTHETTIRSINARHQWNRYAWFHSLPQWECCVICWTGSVTTYLQSPNWYGTHHITSQGLLQLTSHHRVCYNLPAISQLVWNTPHHIAEFLHQTFPDLLSTGKWHKSDCACQCNAWLVI